MVVEIPRWTNAKVEVKKNSWIVCVYVTDIYLRLPQKKNLTL